MWQWNRCRPISTWPFLLTGLVTGLSRGVYKCYHQAFRFVLCFLAYGLLSPVRIFICLVLMLIRFSLRPTTICHFYFGVDTQFKVLHRHGVTTVIISKPWANSKYIQLRAYSYIDDLPEAPQLPFGVIISWPLPYIYPFITPRIIWFATINEPSRFDVTNYEAIEKQWLP